MRSTIGIIVFWVLLIGNADAFPADRIIPHFRHTSFSIEDGAPAGAGAIVQGPDGYLYFGAENGLSRFDGVKFEHIERGKSSRKKSEEIDDLKFDRNGQLWVGHDIRGVSILKSGELVDANGDYVIGAIRRLTEDLSGHIWALANSVGRVGQIERNISGHWINQNVGRDLPKERASDMLITSDDTLWIAYAQSLMRLRPGAKHFEKFPLSSTRGTRLVEMPDHSVLLASKLGVFRIPPKSDGDYSELVAFDGKSYPSKIAVDYLGGIWVAHPMYGLMRIHPLVAGQPVTFDTISTDWLTAPHVESIEPDREGDMWVSTARGVDRFSPADVVFAHSDPPTQEGDSALEFNVLSTTKGDIFFTGSNKIYTPAANNGVSEVLPWISEYDVICSNNDGGIWVSEGTDLKTFGSEPQRAIPLPESAARLDKDGRRAPLDECTEDARGRVWLVTDDGTSFWDQMWHSVTLKNGMDLVSPTAIEPGPDADVFAYVGNEPLFRLDGDKVQTILAHGTSPIGFILTMRRDATGAMLLCGRDGLARVKNGVMAVLSAEIYPFLKGIEGIAQTPSGETWLHGDSGLVRISTRQLENAFSKPGTPLVPRIFNYEDGLQGTLDYNGTNTLALAKDGRIWIATTTGIFWIDPSKLLHNAVAPAVHITGVIADGVRHGALGAIILPKATANLEIDYTAISLPHPSRMQFRYRLEGFDRSWVNPGLRREAFYTNLSPGKYRFQVRAANNDGVWSTNGASIDFELPPTFLQSDTFKILVAVAVLVLLYILFRVRVDYVSTRLRRGIEERMRERERIARELHDTLLQGFQALTLRLQNIIDGMPSAEPQYALIEQELERADAVLVEGRNRVRDLRGQTNMLPLEELFSEAAHGITASFACNVSGTVRQLRFVAHAEIGKIGIEAITNAAQHAQAKNIEVRLAYRPNIFVLTVLDDGIGIDPGVADDRQKAGHFGIVGMRERADVIQGELAIRTAKNSGTTIELAVPGSVAYAGDGEGRSILAYLRRVLVGPLGDLG